LRKPNHYQTRVGFYQWWVMSKLNHGNTYVLKARDDRGRPFLKFVKGAITKRVRLPAIIDQKVWRAGTKYFKGDAVTHNRSLFIAQVDQPSGKPEDASGDWRLAVMRGRDAAQPKPAPED